MSIYATLEHFYLPETPLSDRFPEEFIEIYVQGVPGHIDHTGPEWDFLPPPVSEDSGLYRLVVVCAPETRKGTMRNPQEYVDPLFVLTGEEYARMTWNEMWERIYHALETRLAQAIEKHNRVTRAELEEKVRLQSLKQLV